MQEDMLRSKKAYTAPLLISPESFGLSKRRFIAQGATGDCATGNSPVANCTDGTGATSGTCASGTTAGASCGAGTTVISCTTGSSATDCVSGTDATADCSGGTGAS